MEEIVELDQSRETEPHLRSSQKRLAEVLTQIVHRQDGLDAARKATDIFFGSEIQDLCDEQLLDIFADVPSVEISRDVLTGGQFNIVDALVDSGLCSSRGDARRSIEQGGGYVNNRRVESLDTNLSEQDLASDTVIVLRRGKKKYALVRVAN